jgi:type IV secretion system protein VirB10
MSEMATQPAEENAMRPVVRTGNAGNRSVWLFGGALLVGGLLLFNALNTHRQDLATSTALPQGRGGGLIAAPPPLSLPQGYAEPPDEALRYPERRTLPGPVSPAPQPATVTRVIERTVPAPVPTVPAPPVQPAFPPPVPAVIERPALAAAELTDGVAADDERVSARRLRNPSLTVPQGTIIAAVLETALDSTRPGGVRALVSRDVRSFDGSRVLIPRGSRLYGEYMSDMAAGQKRALVQWHRLTRPDAVIIDLDSPAADPLGRAGIKGEVNTHFFERFGGAILQSVLDIGVGLATRTVADDTVIVGLPGSTQQVTGQQQLSQVQPTLKVKQGASVSVFVARDLDFSTVDR